MKSKEQCIALVNQFIAEYFPNSSGVMLTGSFVSNYFNEFSDLDVILLSVWHRKTFIESYDYNSVKIQIIALPLLDVQGILARDAMSRNGAIISMLSKGQILWDPKGILQNLKTQATALIKQKRVVSREVLDMERSKLTTLFEDICGLQDHEELVFTIADAMPKALNLYLLSKGAWVHQAKSAARDLRESHDDFLLTYVGAFDKFFIHRDKSAIENLISKVLDSAGGKLHFHSTKRYKDVADADNMVVFVSPRTNDASLESLQNLESAFCAFVDRRLPALQYVSFVLYEDGLFNRGLYIIVASTRQQLNEHVIPLIHEFHLGNPASVTSGLSQHWNYPFAINPLEVRNMFAAPFFDLLCKVNREKFRHTNRRLFAIDILGSIVKSDASNCAPCKMSTYFNPWLAVFDMYLSSHLNKMLPSECIDLVGNLKREQIKKEYDNMVTAFGEPKCHSWINGLDLSPILQSIKELNAPGSEALMVSKDEVLSYNLYRFADTLLDVIGACSLDDKMFVAYALGQQI